MRAAAPKGVDAFIRLRGPEYVDWRSILGCHPLDRVRDAFVELEQGLTRGKIVVYP